MGARGGGGSRGGRAGGGGQSSMSQFMTPWVKSTLDSGKTVRMGIAINDYDHSQKAKYAQQLKSAGAKTASDGSSYIDFKSVGSFNKKAANLNGWHSTGWVTV